MTQHPTIHDGCDFTRVRNTEEQRAVEDRGRRVCPGGHAHTWKLIEVDTPELGVWPGRLPVVDGLPVAGAEPEVGVVFARWARVGGRSVPEPAWRLPGRAASMLVGPDQRDHRQMRLVTQISPSSGPRAGR